MVGEKSYKSRDSGSDSSLGPLHVKSLGFRLPLYVYGKMQKLVAS